MMKLFFNKTMLCSLVLCGSISAQAVKLGYMPGEVLIRYKKTMSISAASNRLQKDRLTFVSKLMKPKNQNNYEVIHARISGNETVEEAIKRLSADPTVESVQPNFKYKILATPNDPYFNMQWALKNTAQDVIDVDIAGPDFPSVEGIPAVSGRDMNLTVAWDTVKNCDSVKVAVIDSGIKYDHEDLAANMWDGTADGFPNHGYDTFNGDNNPIDDNGHGTHVAGIIGAVGNNAKGTTGVCWTAKLMAVKVMNAASNGTNNTTAVKYPCNHRDVNTICVAATGQNNRLASFSNFSSTYVDVGAPGINIISPWYLTRAAATVTFATGWTSSLAGSVWGPQTLSGAVDAITVPVDWNGTYKYADGSDTKIHQDFDFTGVSQIWFERDVISNLGSGGDFLKTYVKTGVGSPFSGGTLLDTYLSSSNTGSASSAKIFNVSDECAGGDCTIGFHFYSDTPGGTDTTVSTGVVVHSMKLTKFSIGTTGYNMIRGTSMASPHVAGLAALIRARNPDYTAADVVTAIKNGGVSNTFLSSKTTTGKSVSATGALSYILPPTGVTAIQD